jgi:CHAD domain-containing protein
MKQQGTRAARLAAPFDPGALLARSLDDRWEVFRKQLARALRRPSEPAIHDLRVATRRLIALLSMIDSIIPSGRMEKARRQLRGHLKSFNELRDVHVQLLRVGGMVRKFPQLRAFATDLRMRERRLKREAAREVRSIRVASLERVLAEELEVVLGLVGDRSMKGAGNAMLAGLGGRAFAMAVQRRQAIDPADARSLHRFRVAFKKFRYTIEILRPQLGWVTKQTLKQLNVYQTAMGEIQDLQVLSASLRSFVLRRGQLMSMASMPVYQHLADLRRRAMEEFLARADDLYQFWQ